MLKRFLRIKNILMRIFSSFKRSEQLCCRHT